MPEIQRSSSDDSDVVMTNACLSPSPEPPSHSRNQYVVPLAASQSKSQESQLPVTPTKYETFITLFTNCCTPPTNNSECGLEYVKEEAEYWGQTWENLDGTQKCLFGFLCLKNQFLILLNENNKDTNVVKKKVSMALDPATPQRSKLEAFIRRGGDQPDKTSCDRLYQDFIKSDEELDVKETYSIFNAMTEGNHVLQPIFRYQTENSVVCFLICAANAISYTMELRSQSNAQESFQQYSINIGRYMRNNLSDKDIYRCVFAERGGGYPLNILEELLTATRNGIVNPTNTVDTSFVDDDDDDLSSEVFIYFKRRLKRYGPIMLTNFRTFPDFANAEKTLFSGDWNVLLGKDYTETLHAILITGVRAVPNESHGGVLFEVQDSLQKRPFLYLGLDLLKSMGKLSMHQIEKGVAFSGAQLAFANNEEDTREVSYMSGNQSPVSGQEEQKLSLSKDDGNVRKQISYFFDDRFDWITAESPNRINGIWT